MKKITAVMAVVLALIAFSVKNAKAEIFTEVECAAPYNGRCVDINWDPPGYVYGLPGIFIITTKAEDFREFYNLARKQQRDFLQLNFRLMLPVHETMVVKEDTTRAEALICSGTYPQLLLLSSLAWFSFTGDIHVPWMGWGATGFFGYISYEQKDLSGNTPPTTTIPAEVCNKDGICGTGETYFNCEDCPAPDPITYIGEPELISGTIQGDTAQYRFRVDDSICFATGETATGKAWETKNVSNGYVITRFKMGTTMRISIKKNPCGSKDFIDPVDAWPERAYCEQGTEKRSLCSFQFTMPTGTAPPTTTTCPPTTTTTVYIPPTTTTTVVIPPVCQNIVDGNIVRVATYSDGTALYEISFNSYAPGSDLRLKGQDYLDEFKWSKYYPTVRTRVIQVRWPVGTVFEASLQYFDVSWLYFGSPEIECCLFWNGIQGPNAHFHFYMP